MFSISSKMMSVLSECDASLAGNIRSIARASSEQQEIYLKEAKPVHLDCNDDGSVVISRHRDESLSNGQVTKIGRAVRRVFNDRFIDTCGITDKKIEDLTNEFIANLKRKNDVDFKIVKGDDLVKCYHGDNYYEGSGTLNSSCMRGNDKNKFLQIFARNPEVCSMLVQIKNKKVYGRAILWQFKCLDSGINFKLMDRVYYCKDYQIDIFIKWAKENGFHYKSKQSHSNPTFVHHKTGTQIHRQMKIPLKVMTFKSYPYLDTFYYASHQGGYITQVGDDPNVDDNMRKLDGYTQSMVRDRNDVRERCNLIHVNNPDTFPCVDGGYTSVKNSYPDALRDDHRVPKAFAVESRYHEGYVHKDRCQLFGSPPDWVSRDHIVSFRGVSYLKNDCIQNDEGSYIPKSECIEVDGVHLFKGDCVESQHHGKYIKKSESFEYEGDYYLNEIGEVSHYHNATIPAHLAVWVDSLGYVLASVSDIELNLEADGDDLF